MNKLKEQYVDPRLVELCDIENQRGPYMTFLVLANEGRNAGTNQARPSGANRATADADAAMKLLLNPA